MNPGTEWTNPACGNGTPPASSCVPMKYLVADDDPLVCEQVESFLTRLGDTEFCLKAGDGLPALQLLSAGGSVAAFLDLRMPGLDRVSLLRALPRGLPIVIVSASNEFGAGSYEFSVADY